MSKFIVFDRDGTLIKYVPYLRDPSNVELLPFVKEVISEFKKLEFKLFLHTNQSAISKGRFSINDVNSCNNRMIELLDLGPEVFDGICIAQDYDDIKGYRKPSPKFGKEIIEKYLINQKDLIYVGDSMLDYKTALNLNCTFFGVKTGIDLASKNDFLKYEKYFYNNLLEIRNNIID